MTKDELIDFALVLETENKNFLNKYAFQENRKYSI